jgi:hypothetical protein
MAEATRADGTHFLVLVNKYDTAWLDRRIRERFLPVGWENECRSKPGSAWYIFGRGKSQSGDAG